MSPDGDTPDRTTPKETGSGIRDCLGLAACLGCLALIAFAVAAAAVLAFLALAPDGDGSGVTGWLDGADDRAEAQGYFDRGTEILQEADAVDEMQLAVVELEKALELDGSLDEARLNLALAYEALGRLGDAEDLLLELKKRGCRDRNVDWTLDRVKAGQRSPENYPRGGEL